MTTLKIEVDGKILNIPVHNNAKVIVENPAEGVNADVHINVTHEGVIFDVVRSADGEVVDTETMAFDDMIEESPDSN